MTRRRNGAARAAAPASVGKADAAGGEAQWQAILDAGDNSRRNSGEWGDYSPYLPTTVWKALGDRVAADGRAARRGNVRVNLAVRHYLQVAFSAMPTLDDGSIDVEAVAAEGRTWLADHRGMPPRKSTGSALRTDLKDELVYLSQQLRYTQPRVEIWVILTVYAEKLLDSLPPSDRLAGLLNSGDDR